MTKKAGRLDSADLTAALGQAGDLAKARIVQLDAATLDAVAGGTEPVSTATGTPILLGMGDIDIATDGMAPSDHDSWLDFLNGGDSSEF